MYIEDESKDESEDESEDRVRVVRGLSPRTVVRGRQSVYTEVGRPRCTGPGVYPARVHPVPAMPTTCTSLATCCTCGARAANEPSRHETSIRVYPRYLTVPYGTFMLCTGRPGALNDPYRQSRPPTKGTVSSALVGLDARDGSWAPDSATISSRSTSIRPRPKAEAGY